MFIFNVLCECVSPKKTSKKPDTEEPEEENPVAIPQSTKNFPATFRFPEEKDKTLLDKWISEIDL